MLWILTFALAPLAVAHSASAQNSSSDQNHWDYTATSYGWFPGITTTVETPIGEFESEIEFEEILENLDIAFLSAFEARKGRLALIGDVQFYDIGAAIEPPVGTLFSGGEIDSKLFIVSAYATYAVIDRADLRLDLGGGLRYIDATFETDLEGQGTNPDGFFSADGGWSDVLLVARLTRRFNDNWHGVAYADFGGFGIGDSADFTFQAAVAAGYQINEKWSALGGFRYLSFERAFGGQDVAQDVSGPFVGFQATF